MKTVEIKSGGKTAAGLEFPLGNAVLVAARAEKGYVMCGYLSIETAEKLWDAAGVVRGVKTIEELLDGKVSGMTSKAKILGVETGMTGREALEKMA